MQMHRREWVCEEHGTTFPTQDLFVEHVKESHWSVQTQKQIAALAEISERSMKNDTIVECPFCPDERRLMILHTHIAEHLESISLFVLSATFEDEEEENNDSRDVADGDVSSRLASLSTFQKTSEFEMEPDLGAASKGIYAKSISWQDRTWICFIKWLEMV
jgi:hypothetical protein